MRDPRFSPEQVFTAAGVEHDARIVARVAHQSVVDWPRRRRNLFLRVLALVALTIGMGVVAWPLALFVLTVTAGALIADPGTLWWACQGTRGDLARARADRAAAIELHGRALAALREMDPDRLPLDTIDEERP